jgi:hypothetical protein
MKKTAPWKTFAAATAFSLLTAGSAWAVCGDNIVEEGEDCDGGACCEQDCSFSTTAETCRPIVNAACDVAETCSGSSAECPEDVLVGCVDQDGIACTEPSCNPDGTCGETDECTEICRGPGFWATHSGTQNGGTNIGQSVIDSGGALEVCGQSITASDATDSLNSLVEALCVKTKGVEERQLYRQLVTTALNCSLSEGGTCDDILSRFVDVSFTECNALCAGDPVEEGPTIDECRSQLACFNRGGRLEEGECVTGTCEEDPEIFCRSDEDCPLVNDLAQECVDFEDNCADERICSEELDSDAQICPTKRRASSVAACKEARQNECTIDDCE